MNPWDLLGWLAAGCVAVLLVLVTAALTMALWNGLGAMVRNGRAERAVRAWGRVGRER